MAESYLFDFNKTPNFMRFLNVKYHITNMTGANQFEFVLCSYSGNDIKDCLNTDNTINTDNVTVYDSVVGGLKYGNDDNGTEIFSISDDVTFTIDEDIVPLKALFIRDNTSKAVLFYCINQTAFTVTNSFIIDKDTILATIVDSEFRL